MSFDRYYRLWADVDLDAIRSNILQIQAGLTPGTMSCAVIKADAYGHGAIQVARAVSDLVDYFAVATLDEAMKLREYQVKHPILILGYVDPVFAETAACNQVRLTVYDMDQALEISQQVPESMQVLVHIKLDTGMGRIGFQPTPESVRKILQIAKLPGICVEGIFTHFANADGQTPDATFVQLDAFQRVIRGLEEQGLQIPVKHCANSAAAMYLRETDMDMVRLGISMYGMYPSSYVKQIRLQPALSLKSRVVHVKTVPKGFRVGYGSTWAAPDTSRIATVPVGYADGYFRSLSNLGYVLIGGAKYQIAGRVCMDQIMIDVTKPIETCGPYTGVCRGDEVVLTGRSGGLMITAEEISELAGSFNYEFVCGLSLRVPRIYYRDGEALETRDLLSSL